MAGSELRPTSAQPDSARGAELKQALVLYEQLVKIRFVLGNSARPSPADVNGLVPLLTEERLPWPQLEYLRSLHLHLQNIFDESDIRPLQGEVTALVTDLAIWIVENYFRPRSPAEVNLPRPDFHRAGIGRILYCCYEREREGAPRKNTNGCDCCLNIGLILSGTAKSRCRCHRKYPL